MTNSLRPRADRRNPLHSQEIADAIDYLNQFICSEQSKNDSESAQLLSKSLQDGPERSELFQALTVVLAESEYQILGICAESYQEGMMALTQYLAAFDEEVQPTCEDPGQAIYIKYNTKTQRCYSEPYDGVHRGVILSCQSPYDDGVNETFGHFPLNLFDQP